MPQTRRGGGLIDVVIDVKNATRATLRAAGFDIIRYKPHCSPEAALAKMLRHHRIDILVDVGANEGQYAQLIRQIGFDGRIISFEPLRVAHQRLEMAASRDPMWNVAPRIALGDQEGEVEINVASNGGASSSILRMLDAHKRAAPEVKYIGSETVSISRLDRVARTFLGDDSQKIFLKLDVQGYEMQVLRGSEGLLDRIVGAQLEVSLAPLYEGQPLLASVGDYMSSKGFEIWGIVPGFVDDSSGRMLQLDVIFFRTLPQRL